MGSYGSPVIVRRKEVVAAVLPVQEHWLPMSNLDLLLPPLDFGVFLCYKKKNDPGPQENMNMVSVIKKSLAQVLVSFYPLAGELVKNNLGEPELLCNNRGVDFVLAYYDVELKGLDLHHPDDSVHGKLVPFRNEGVLSIQVTELKCGGLVIGCTFDHRVADAHTANMFLAAWAEIAQSKPIAHIPFVRRSILNPRRPIQCDPCFDDMYAPISSLPPPPLISNDDHLLSRIYFVPAEEIIRIQSSAMENGNKRSKLQSFTAYLWKIIAEGDNDAFSSTCRMGIVVDGRERLMINGGKDDNSSSLSAQNYFGNVLSIPFGEASCDELKAMPLSQVADMVHGFLASATTEEHFRGLIDWVELHRPEPAVARIYCQLKECEGEAVVVSSGQRFPVDKMDFGWGGADFGSYHFPWGGQTGYVMPMPSASKEGDWIVYMHLSKKHLDLVETKGAHVLRPLTRNYLNF